MRVYVVIDKLNTVLAVCSTAERARSYARRITQESMLYPCRVLVFDVLD